MPDTYVALDLETTGLEAHLHEIIEVGAVKFRGAEVLDTFESFVKPRTALSREIQQLTGITAADLRKAPPFPVVAGDLLDFVSDYPLVIQNAAFDLAFLREQGLPLSNRVLDTLELAKVLLGGLPERNLPALAAHFGIDYGTHHRALRDARTAKDVFLALRERALSLDPRILNPLAGLGAGSNWALHTFFQEVLAEKITASLAESVELAAKGGLGSGHFPLPGERAGRSLRPVEGMRTDPLSPDGRRLGRG